MASTEYSGAARKGAESINLFEGLKFFLAAHVPLRSRYKLDIESRGGVVVKSEEPDAIIVVDHLKARQIKTPNAYSYKFIDDSLKEGSIADRETYRISQAQESTRPAGDPSIRRRSAKVPYTKEEDCWLWDYMTDAVRKGVASAGKNVFQQISAERPQHSWQSWRERWLKKLEGTQRPLPLPPDEDHQPTVRESSADPEQVPTTEIANIAAAGLLSLRDVAATTPPPPQEASELHEPNSDARGEGQVVRQTDGTVLGNLLGDNEDLAPSQESSQSQETNIKANAADQLELWKNAKGIFMLESLPDEYAERWEGMAKFEDYKHHSAEEWQLIWEQLVRPNWLEQRPEAEKPTETKKGSPNINQDTVQIDENLEQSDSQDKSAGQHRHDQRPNLPNSSRRLTSTRHSVQTSQSSSGQSQVKDIPTAKRSRESDALLENTATSLSPRKSKRLKLQNESQSAGEKREETRSGEIQGSPELESQHREESSNEEAEIRQAPEASESAHEDARGHVFDRPQTRIEENSRRTGVSLQDDDLTDDMSDSERPESQGSGRRDGGSQRQPPTGRNEDTSTDSDESSEDGNIRETPHLDTQAIFGEESVGDFLDIPSPGLGPIDVVQVHDSPPDGEVPSSSNLTTTTPGNTAPPARMSPLPSQRNVSTAGSYIETTQPGFTSQPRISSSSGRGSRTSLISSGRESSETLDHAMAHKSGRKSGTAIGSSREEVERWWAAKRDSRETEENIKAAYDASCGHFDTANMALVNLRLSKRLPEKRGVWTKQDDVDLQNVDARRVQRVLSKHGDKNVKMRMDWLASNR